MRNLQRLLKSSLSFGGSGTYNVGPHWARPDISLNWSPGGDREAITCNFEGYVAGAYKGNGIVFACVQARAHLFAQARFQYQRFERGRPGDLFGDPSLDVLERPWPNGTTAELLFRMEQDVSLAGNFFATTNRNGHIKRLRPDWVTIVTGSPEKGNSYHVDAEIIGYLYTARPNGVPVDPVLLSPEKVVHYSPIPDPEAQWRGMSWMTPVIKEISADNATTLHKEKFFENGTSTNFVVSYSDKLSRDQFLAQVEAFKAAHQGGHNAYKTIHLGGGADITPVSSTLKDLDFKNVQGAGETRIAAASGVGAVVAGISEGLQGSSLNAGNFESAKQQFADMTGRPLWSSAASALQKFTSPPAGCRLWIDDRDIPFLKADLQKAAEVQNQKARTIRTLADGGFDPDSVIAAVQADDFRLLKHTGRLSVQLQEPGAQPTT